VIGMPDKPITARPRRGLSGSPKPGERDGALGLRVNAIAPGFIETEMTASMDEAVRKKLYAQIPMGEPGSAQDVAKLVLYLAGETRATSLDKPGIWTVD